MSPSKSSGEADKGLRTMAVDIGNTRLKAGVFSSLKLQQVLINPSMERLAEVVVEEQIAQVIYCSVGNNPQPLEAHFTSGVKVVQLDHQLAVPIKNRYQSPQTLGMDRLAAAVGAWHQYPHENCLVIDAGTSITYDLIDEHGNYQGGGIAPGIELRYRSLHQHTSKLPLVSGNRELPPLVGKDTAGSIQSGVLHGVVAEIEGIIRRYNHKYSNLKVILCGGDSTFFERTLKAPIFVVPHLVLLGLNRILIYHAHGI